MGALPTIIAKDMRLLLRDRAALAFIAIAPVVVICVAGFSLANFYGADPTGQTAYDFPIADEDGGEIAREIRERLARETAVRAYDVASRADAERLVRNKRAGSALVIPAGTEAALAEGREARLLLYTDPVKYLERLNVRVRLLELRDDLAQRRRSQAAAALEQARERLRARFEEIEREIAAAHSDVQRLRARGGAARAKAQRELEAQVARVREAVARQVAREMEALVRDVEAAVAERTDEVRRAAGGYLAELRRARTDFDAWMAELRRIAGRRAGDIPQPPRFPEPPAELERMLAREPAPLGLPSDFEVRLAIPAVALPDLPEVPEAPAPRSLEVRSFALPEAEAIGAALAVEEVNVSGGPLVVNTFDQNVPGFSVTFLLLGMLLGVSMGLLDERDWGTFSRVLATPTPARNILVGKLVSRFLVGVVQMLALFAVGWAVFDVSLGPQPWALLAPIAAIVFAGVAFGLVVAVVTDSREAVLPLGSMAIVTMAAVGGCWWPIDLEPRWMRQIALAFPTTWAMEAFNDLMIRRRGFEAALRPTAVMLAYGILYLVLGLALFRRRLRG